MADDVAAVGAVELGGVREFGVLAGELLDQALELRGAGLDLHGVGYVDDLDGVVFLGFGLFGCCFSLVHSRLQ